MEINYRFSFDLRDLLHPRCGNVTRNINQNAIYSNHFNCDVLRINEKLFNQIINKTEEGKLEMNKF